MNHDPLAALPEAARSLLEAARIGRLATANLEGVPHAIPVCYALLAGRIYSVVDAKPKRTLRLARLRNIEANPHVTLIVDRYDEDWSQLAWVMVRGTARVSGADERTDDALAALRAKYEQYRSMDLEGRPLVELNPTRATAWQASS